MSLRQQQVAVFLATVLIIFGLFAAGVWLIARRLTTEATLQTALLMARQVEIALADSLRDRPMVRPRAPAQPQSSSFWSFLGNIFPGSNRASRAPSNAIRPPSRRTEVTGLMRAYIDRSTGIEAMWVLNADGKVLYSSMGDEEKEQSLSDTVLNEKLRRGITTINSIANGRSS